MCVIDYTTKKVTTFATGFANYLAVLQCNRYSISIVYSVQELSCTENT